MLAVFEKSIGKPPSELSIPVMGRTQLPKSRSDIVGMFRSSWPDSTFCDLSNGSFMALSHSDENPLYPRSIVILDNVFCIFRGCLENISDLRRHYGLSPHATEAMLIVEVYRVLRDRAPYPLDQVIKDLIGKFAFILFDVKSGTLLIARDRDGGVKLQWGISGDESLVCSDDPDIMSEACGKSCTQFPSGCIFLNGSGLVSFDHPLNKVRVIVRKDDDGNVCGVFFQVDLYARLPSIPRVGSDANWANATIAEENNDAN